WEMLFGTVITLVWLRAIGMGSAWDNVLVGSIGLQYWLAVNRAFFERGMRFRRLATMEGMTALLGHAVAVPLAIAAAGATALYVREALIAIGRGAGLARIGGLTLCRLRWISVPEWRALAREARDVSLDGV